MTDSLASSSLFSKPERKQIDDRPPEFASNAELPIGGIVWLMKPGYSQFKALSREIVSWPKREYARDTGFAQNGSQHDYDSNYHSVEWLSRCTFDSDYTAGRPAIVVEKHGQDKVGIFVLTSLHSRSMSQKSSKRQKFLVPIELDTEQTSKLGVKWKRGFCDLRALHIVSVQMLKKFWDCPPSELTLSKSLTHTTVERWHEIWNVPAICRPLYCWHLRCFPPADSDPSHLHRCPESEAALWPIIERVGLPKPLEPSDQEIKVWTSLEVCEKVRYRIAHHILKPSREYDMLAQATSTFVAKCAMFELLQAYPSVFRGMDVELPGNKKCIDEMCDSLTEYLRTFAANHTKMPSLFDAVEEAERVLSLGWHCFAPLHQRICALREKILGVRPKGEKVEDGVGYATGPRYERRYDPRRVVRRRWSAEWAAHFKRRGQAEKKEYAERDDIPEEEI